MLFIVIAFIGAAAAAAFASSRVFQAGRSSAAWMIDRERDLAWDWEQDR